MKQTRHSEETLRRYLLGESPAPEQAALETEFFADRELYEQVCEAENDLIEDYLRGTMPPTDREQFERHYFATPERRQQVEFARAMMRSLAQTEPTASAERIIAGGVSPRLAGWWASLLAPLRWPRPALGFSLAQPVLLVQAGAWLLVARRDSSRDQVASQALRAREQELEKQLASEHEQNKQLTAELERVRDQLRVIEEKQTGSHPTPAIVTILLSGGPGREESKQQTFRIPPTAEVVQIQLKLNRSDHPNYRATVKTAEGRSIWSRTGIHASGATVSFRIPARLLPTGDYLLTLDGVTAAGVVEDVNQSYFRVDNR